VLNIDLHVHTSDSLCGLHSLLEVLEMVRERGLKAVAITDHGSALGGIVRNPFFFASRTPDTYKGLRLLKGMEANLLETNGKTDIPLRLLSHLDVLLMGLHAPFSGKGIADNTRAFLALLEEGPPIDIITHPDICFYPLELEEIVPVAAQRGVALELNNTNLVVGKTVLEQTRKMLELGRRHDALFALNSDGHTWHEIGHDEAVRRLLEEWEVPPLHIINDWPLDRLLGHLASRRQMRQDYAKEHAPPETDPAAYSIPHESRPLPGSANDLLPDERS
jgi:putative hydrolase